MKKLEIRAMLPGVFYRKPSPDSPPFKKDGDPVKEGDVLGLIEVMKSFHEVHAEVSGMNIVYRMGDSEAVMAGQVIAEVDG